MPITNHYSGEFIETRMAGVIVAADLPGHAQDLARIEAGLPASPHRIADLTAVTGGDVSFDQVNGFAALRRTARLRNPVKSAIVVRTPVQFGVARTFQTLNDNPDITIRVFRDDAEARAWLRNTPATAG